MTMSIVSVKQMQEIEKNADQAGISYREMMENAGRGVAKWVYENFSKTPCVLGLIGSGNNGGDTLVALEYLSQWGLRTIGFIVKNRKNDELMESYAKVGGSIIDISDGKNFEYLDAGLIHGTIVLDGILGTGMKLPLRGQLELVMGKIFDTVEKRSDVSVVAVDCPSGIDCDTGEASDVTLFAKHTLTMAAVKQGLLIHPAREKSGDLHVIDIGIGDPSTYISVQLPKMITEEMVRGFLPIRPADGHKGTFGTCFIIAGTPNYTGAAYLTGKAAYRGGCGLVHMATLNPVHASLSSHLVEAVWTILPGSAGFYDPSGVAQLESKISLADSLVIGPGWGLVENNVKFLERILSILPEELLSVFDADGLKLLKQIPQWWHLVPKQTILTPHPGEMAILSDSEISDVQSNRWEVAKEFAEKWGVTLILKGAETVIADQNGRLWINPVSETALATAGSGDVLSGLLGGLLAQGISTTQAAIAGTFLHSQAGKLAKVNLGTDICVTAVDVLDSIPGAFSAIDSK